MGYIDAEKLIKIIEERKAKQDQWVNRYRDPINQGVSHELAEILSLITSLPQVQPHFADADKMEKSEVDLEKEIEARIRFLNGTHTLENDERWYKGKYENLKEFALYFYELGRDEQMRMAGQGVKAEATVGYYNQCGLSVLTEPSIKKLGFNEGDELEITLRKK